MYQKEIKVNNETKLFRYIFNLEQPFSIPEIAKSTDMSFPTVKRILSKFLKKGIIYEWALSTGGVGRRAVEYKFNSTFCYSVGASLDEEKIKIILIDTKGTKILYKEYMYNKKDTLIFLIESLKNFILNLEEKYRNLLIGVGISIPGIHNKENGFIELNLNKKYSVNIIQEIEKEINHPIWIENEANMSILAEAILSKNKDLSDFTIINISNNVSCSTFYNFGTTNEEYFFKASRVHYMIVDYEKQKTIGDCISYKVLKEKVKENFSDKISVDKFFETKKYREGKIGKEIINEYLIYLGIILKNLIYSYNPKKLIICGKLSRYKDFLHEAILNEIYTENHNFYRGRETVIFSNFNGDSSMIGAAIFPIVDKLM